MCHLTITQCSSYSKYNLSTVSINVTQHTRQMQQTYNKQCNRMVIDYYFSSGQSIDSRSAVTSLISSRSFYSSITSQFQLFHTQIWLNNFFNFKKLPNLTESCHIAEGHQRSAVIVSVHTLYDLNAIEILHLNLSGIHNEKPRLKGQPLHARDNKQTAIKMHIINYTS